MAIKAVATININVFIFLYYRIAYKVSLVVYFGLYHTSVKYNISRQCQFLFSLSPG